MHFILSGWGNWASQWRIFEDAVPEAEQLGFWGFVMPDHYMWGSRMGGDATLDTWVALSYLAARTEKIRLGTLVTPIPFRPPGMLAKIVSTIDVLSKGRTILGVGAGWSQTEFEGYSAWDEPRVRVDKTREGLELILKLWTEKSVDFKGKYFHAKGAVLEPKPVQKPHPRLLFGGTKTRMFRMAGEYADICTIPPFAQGDLVKAHEIVEQEARAHSRDGKLSFATIGPPPQFAPKYDRKVFMKSVEEASRAGSKYFIAPFPDDGLAESMRDFAKAVIPS